MLHRCESCHQRQQQIERLSEGDGAVEWWQVAVVIASGEQVRRQRRWRIE